MAELNNGNDSLLDGAIAPITPESSLTVDRAKTTSKLLLYNQPSSVSIPETKDPNNTSKFGFGAEPTPPPQIYGRDILPSEYSKYVGNVYPEAGVQNLDVERAQNQTGGEKLLNTLASATIGEVGGGFVKDIAYLMGGPSSLSVDAEQGVGKKLIAAGTALQEMGDERFPVYADPNAKKFDPSSWTWWLQNAKGMASIIPAAALAYTGAGAVGGLAEVLGIPEALGLGALEMEGASHVIKGITSRQIYNMMFAHSTYQEVYNAGLQKGMSIGDANKKASIAASDSYMKNWALLPLDIMQYGIVTKALANQKNALGYEAAVLSGKTVEEASANIVKTGLNALSKEVAIGGGQLGFQWIMSEEGKFAAEKAFDPSIKGNLSSRVNDYLQSGDFWSSVVMGGMGGAIFTGVGKGLGKVFEKAFKIEDPQVKEVKSWASSLKDATDRYNEATRRGDKQMADEATKDHEIQLGTRLGQSGLIDDGVDFFRKLVKGGFTPEEGEKLGLSPEDIDNLKSVNPEDVEKSVKNIREAAEKYQERFVESLKEGTDLNKSLKKLYDERTDDMKKATITDYARMYAGLISQTETKINRLNEARQQLESDLENTKGKIVNWSSLSTNKQQQWLEESHLSALESQKIIVDSTYNQIREDETFDESYKKDLKFQHDTLNQLVKKHQTALDQLKKTYSDEERDNDKGIDITSDSMHDYLDKDYDHVGLLIKIASYQSASDRYRKGIISTKESKVQYNEDLKDEEDDIKDTKPEQGDIVGWVDEETGQKHAGVIHSVDDDYNVQEIDSNFNDVGKPVPKNPEDLELLNKWSDTPVNTTEVEPIADDDIKDPYIIEQENMERDGTNKALSDPSSLSTSNRGSNGKDIVYRDIDLYNYSNNPDNKMDDGVASYEIDWNNQFWDNHKEDKLSLQKGESIEELLSSEKDPDIYDKLVDKIPIKVSIGVKDKSFDKGLYVHDSDFWNVRMPFSLGQDPILFEKNWRDTIRKQRRVIISSILEGKDVNTKDLRKLSGHFNTVKTFDNVHKRFNIKPGEFKVYVGTEGLLGTTMATASSTDSSIAEGLTRGGIYMRINKTANGEYRYVKLTPNKLSEEHASILLDSIIIKEIRGGGRKVKLSDVDKKDTRVEGLNVSETIHLLALLGDKLTNPDHPNNKDKNLDVNKQLWIDYSGGKKILHYGVNTLDIFENNSDQRNRDRVDFINWATTNKNYRVAIDNKPMGLSLNEPFQRKFKIGSFTNDPVEKKSYAAVLMDTKIGENPDGTSKYIISTNVDRVKDTTNGKYVESLTHSPIIDINTRSLDIKDRPKSVEEPVKPKEPVKPGEPEVIQPIKKLSLKDIKPIGFAGKDVFSPKGYPQQMMDETGYVKSITSSEPVKEVEPKPKGYEIAGINIPTIESWADLEDVTKALTHVLIKENKIQNINDIVDVGGEFFKPLLNFISHEATETDNGGMVEQFKAVADSTEDVEEKAYATKLKDLYESIINPQYLPIFVNRINTELRQWNIAKRVIDKDVDDLTHINENSDPNLFLQYLNKAPYELNIKDTINASVKFLIKTLPESEEINPRTYTTRFVDFNATFSNLLRDLHNVDTVDEMLQILDSKSDKFSYKELVSRLRAGDDLLRIQFKVAMNKHKNDFVNFLFSLGNDNRPVYEMSDASMQAAINNEVASWNQTIYESNIIDKSGKPTIDKVKVESLQKEYNTFVTSFSRDYEKSGRSLTDEDIDKYITTFIPTANKIGMDVDRETIDEVVNKISAKESITKSEALNKFFITDFMRILKNLSTGKSIRKLFGDEGITRDIARAKYETKPDLLSDSILGPGGNKYFSYSQNTYLSDVFRGFAKDPSIVANKLSKLYNRHSSFLSQMTDDKVRQNVNILTNSSLIQKNIGDSGRDYLSINRIEDYVTKMYAFERGIVPLPTIGDRRSYYYMTGLKPIEFDLTWGEDNKPIIPQNVIDLFYGYALDEEERIVAADKLIKTYKAESDPKIKEDMLKKMYANYHYTKRGDNPPDFAQANALKHLLFPEFDKTKDFVFERDAKDIINRILLERLNDEMLIAKNKGLIDGAVDKDGTFKPHTNVKLDMGIFNKNLSDHGTERKALENMMARYMIRTMQSSIEYGKLIAGDPAFKKWNKDKGNIDDDYIKRLNSGLSTGDVTNNSSNEYNVDAKNYTVSTMYTQEMSLSKMVYDDILEGQLNQLVKEYSKTPGYEDLATKSQKAQLETLKDKLGINLTQMLGGYLDIDSTDGQAYIRPDMYRSLSISVGEWSPQKEEAFKLLQSDKKLSQEEYIKSLNVALQPLKVLSYGLMTDGDLEVPIHNKMSVATIFRQMGQFGHGEGSRIELMDLLDRMEGKGTYEGLKPIDMVKMNTAVKSGGKVGFNFYSDSNLDKVSDFKEVPVFEEPYNLTRKQLNTDPHDQNDIKVTTQALKIGMSNMQLNDAIYTNPRSTGGKTITGANLAEHISRSIEGLSSKGLSRFEESLKFTNGVVDKESLVNILRSNAEKSGSPDLIVDALKMDANGKDMYLEIDAMPNRKQIMSGVISSARRETADINIPGGQMTQFSNMGVRVNKNDELKFSTVEKDGVNSMECYVSLNIFKHMIPNFDKLSYAEKRDFVLQNKDNIMGYRVPAQGQSSVWILKVKDVFPETIGDVITLPAAFTRLTGSDFDIDKAYVIRYNYEKVDGKFQKVAFKEAPEGVDPYKYNSDEALQNTLMDSYNSILSNLAHTVGTTTPLGSFDKMLNDLADEVHKHDEQKYSSKDLVLHTPSKQSDIKFEHTGGKAGMAPFALNNVHHVLSQIAGLKLKSEYVKMPISMLNTDAEGNLDLSQINGKDHYPISSWISSLINVHIDAAKDPRFMWLNINPTTWDAIGLLIRSGFGLDTFRLTSQPIIKEYSDLMLDSGTSGLSRFKDKREVISYLKTKWIEKEGSDNYDPSSLLTTESLKKHIENKGSDTNAQLKYLSIFESVMTTGKKLNGLVQASQLDANKVSNTIIGLQDSLDRVDKIISDDEFIGLDKMFGEGSFLHSYYKNYLKGTLNIVQDLSIYATPVFREMFSEVKRLTHTNFTSDARLADNMSDELAGAIYAKFFNDLDHVGLNAKKVEEVFNNVTKILTEIKSNPKYEELLKNPLIKMLNKAPIETNDGLPFESYLTVPNKSLSDKASSDAIMYAWRDLFRYDDKKVNNLARLLLYYSYTTSAFRNRIFSFHNYIPADIMKSFEGIDPTDPTKTKSFSFNDFIRTTRELMSDPSNRFMFSDLIDETIINNWSNSKMQPIIPDDNVKHVVYTGEDNTPKAIVNSKFGSYLGRNELNQSVYVKYHTAMIDGKRQELQYIGTVKESIKNKEVELPVYKIIPKRSYEKGGVIIKEMFFDKSIIGDNNVKFIPDGDEFDALRSKENLEKNSIYSTFEPVSNLNTVNTRFKDNIEDADQNRDIVPIPLSDIPKYYEGNIKPDKNTIFVFGSNPEGRHGKGAAKTAVDQFGAHYGQGEGLQGNSYALPTKDLRVKENNGLKSIPSEQIIKNIKTLYSVANQNLDKLFKIGYKNTTDISLNGYTGLEMIDMFNKAGIKPDNIIFSKEWVDTGKLDSSSQPEQLDLFGEQPKPSLKPIGERHYSPAEVIHTLSTEAKTIKDVENTLLGYKYAINPKRFNDKIYLARETNPSKPFNNYDLTKYMVDQINEVIPGLMDLHQENKYDPTKVRDIWTIKIDPVAWDRWLHRADDENYVQGSLFKRTEEHFAKEREDIQNIFARQIDITDAHEYVSNLKDVVPDMSEDHKQLIDLLVNIPNKENISVNQMLSYSTSRVLPKVDGNWKYYDDALGLYRKGTIYLFKDRLIKETKSMVVGTALHELVHGYTLEVLNKEGENRTSEENKFVSEMQELFYRARSITKFTDHNAYDSLREFLADGISDQKIIDELKTMYDPKDTWEGPTKFTFWQKIKSAILRLFGLDSTPKSYHERLLSSIMDYVYKVRKPNTGVENIDALKVRDNIRPVEENPERTKIVDSLIKSEDSYDEIGRRYENLGPMMDRLAIGGLPYELYDEKTKGNMDRYFGADLSTKLHLEKSFHKVTENIETKYTLSSQAKADLDNYFSSIKRPGMTMLSNVTLVDWKENMANKADLITIHKNEEGKEEVHIFKFKSREQGFKEYDNDNVIGKRGIKAFNKYSDYKRDQIEMTIMNNMFKDITNVDVKGLHIIPLRPIFNEINKTQIDRYRLDDSFNGSKVIDMATSINSSLLYINKSKSMNPEDHQDIPTTEEFDLTKDTIEKYRLRMEKMTTKTPEQEVVMKVIKALEKQMAITLKRDKNHKDFKSQMQYINKLVKEEDTQKSIKYVIDQAEQIVKRSFNELQKLKESGDPIKIGKLYRYKDSVSAFNILEDYESLLTSRYGLTTPTSLKDSNPEEYSRIVELRRKLTDIIRLKNSVREDYKNYGLQALAEHILPYYTKIEGEFRRMYSKEYDTYKYDQKHGVVPKLKGQSDADYENYKRSVNTFDPNISKDEYINTKVDAEGNTIQERSKNAIRKELKKAAQDESTLLRWIGNILDTRDAVTNALIKSFVVADDTARIEIDDHRLKSLDVVDEFMKATDQHGHNFSKRFASMLERDSRTGELTGHILTRFPSKLIDEYRNIRAVANSVIEDEDARNTFIYNWKEINMPEDKKSRSKAYLAYLHTLLEEDRITKPEFYRLEYETSKPGKRMFIKDIRNEKDSPITENTEDLILQWFNDNSLTFREPSEKWRNSQWDTLKKILDNPNDHRTKMYNLILKWQELADSKVPDSVKLGTRIPGLIKGKMERLASGQNLTSLVKGSLSKALTFKVDDTHRTQTDLVDNDRNARYFIPTHFTGRVTKTEKDVMGNEYQVFDPEEQSWNLIDNYFHYLGSAIEFQYKNDIMPEMEMARYLLDNRDITVRDNKGIKYATSKFFGGETEENEQLITGGNISKQYSDWLLYSLYGQGQKNLGTIPGTNIDAGKLVNVLQRFTAINLLGLNYMAGANSAILTETIMAIDAFANREIGRHEWKVAQGTFFKNLPGIMGDIGSKKPSNLVSLLLKEFNVSHAGNFGNLTDSKSMTLAKSNAMFFVATFGWWTMQAKTMLGLLERRRAFDKDGKDIGSILSHYKVVNGELTMDKEVDEIKSKWTNKDRRLYEHKIRGVISGIHGDQSHLAHVALQNSALGGMALMFRRFVVPTFLRRWGSEYYNERTEEFQSGMYVSTAKFARQLMKNLSETKSFMLSREWAIADETTKVNVIRSIGEVITIFSSIILANVAISLAKNAKERQDEEATYQMWNFMAYQALRLEAEFRFYTSPMEAMKILRSPAASMSMVEGVAKLGSQLLGPGWEEYKQGPFKGDLKLKKTLIDLTMGVKQYYRARELGEQVSLMKSNVIRTQ